MLGVLWIVVTGLMARAQLEDVRHELKSLRHAAAAGDVRTADQMIRRIEDQAAWADDLTSGPAWWVAAQVPVLGTPMDTAREVTGQVEIIGRTVLPGVQQLASTLSTLPAPHHDSVDLAPLTRIELTLRSAAATSQRVRTRIAATDASWLPTVSDGRSSLLRELTRLVDQTTRADTAVRTLVSMLGSDGPHRYFIGIMNDAESRGLGGLPGSYAILVTDHGSVHFEHFGSDLDFRGVSADVDLGPEYAARYPQAKSTTDYRDSTVSPDFRNAASIWASMWLRKSGERVDGAIALDPTAASYVLGATGPFTSADGTTLTATNIVAVTEQRQYELFGSASRADKLRRKAFLTDLARGMSSRLTTGGSPRRLVAALAKAVRHRRLVVWSADAGLERDLMTLGWSGTLDADGHTFTGFTINNESGSKLDYYVRRTLTYRRHDCKAGGAAQVAIDLHSTAPTHGLPPYVTTRLDPAPPGAKVGDEALLVTFYATPGAMIGDVRVDGRTLILAQLPERGLATVQFPVELAAGGTVHVQVTVTEPAGRRGSVQVLRQPLAHDMDVTVDSCG